jgi:hypothetical protein
VTEWSVRLMRRLYDERPWFCDVAIECIPARRPDEEDTDNAPVKEVVYAHGAVLAARTTYVPWQESYPFKLACVLMNACFHELSHVEYT